MPEQALAALQRCASADWAARPAALATRIALLDAAGNAAAAKDLAESALSSSSSGAPGAAGKQQQSKQERGSAEEFLYQALAKLQLKARADFSPMGLSVQACR